MKRRKLKLKKLQDILEKRKNENNKIKEINKKYNKIINEVDSKKDNNQFE